MNAEIIQNEGGLLVAKNYLKRVGVSDSTITDGIKNYLDGTSMKWKCDPLVVGKDYYFYKDFLPKEIQSLVNQPDNPEDLIASSKFSLRGVHMIELKHAYDKGFEDFVGDYQFIPNKEKRKEVARKHSVILMCIKIYTELECKKGSWLNIHNALLGLKINYFKKSYRYFTRKMNKVLNCKDLSEELRHKAYGRANESAVKVTDYQELLILDLMGKGLSKKEILEEVNKKAKPGKKIKYSTLLRHISTEIKNISAEKRYGYNFFKAHLEPYLLRQKPKFRFQVIEADGSRFQMPYRNEKNKLRFVKIYVVIDIHSTMVLGFSIADEETTEMVITAFTMVFELHHLVPACIITDKSSAHTSKDFKMFRKDTNLFFKTLWREHLPDYPNAKGTVENFFRNFHIQIVKKYFDYVGLSITATSNDHKINKDKLKYLTANRDKLKNKHELIHFISSLIEEWNNHITGEMSPKQKFNLAETGDAKPISSEMIARLSWPHVQRKLDRSRIIFAEYEYAIESNDNRIKWNGTIVDVYFHSSYEDHVYLFDGDTFIEKASKKKFYGEDDKSKFGQIKKNKSFRTYANMLYKENNKALRTAESDDPLIAAYYEDSKLESNAQFAEFVEKHILEMPGEGGSPEFAEFEDIPTLAL